MTNLEWIRTLSAKELSDLLYDYWLPRGQYVWTDSRKGLMKVLGEKYLERDCDKCKHQGNCYCVKGLGCPFEPKTENSSERIKTYDYCDICNHKRCENCVADGRDDYCVPSGYEPKDEPQTDPCDGCVCDDGKHLMYCMNCKGIAWKTEPPKVEDEPQTQLTARCLECNNSKACKENHWQGCRYEPLGYEVTAVVGIIKDEPQTERSE